MNSKTDVNEHSASPPCYADVDDASKWVSMSVEGLTLECIGLAIEAAKMFTDSDTARMHKESGDFRITEDVFRRMLEVNKMGEELLVMMAAKGDEDSSA